MADALRDSVRTNLSKLAGLSFDEIVEKVEKMVQEGN
jgi:hypothetical protein